MIVVRYASHRLSPLTSQQPARRILKVQRHEEPLRLLLLDQVEAIAYFIALLVSRIIVATSYIGVQIKIISQQLPKCLQIVRLREVSVHKVVSPLGVSRFEQVLELSECHQTPNHVFRHVLTVRHDLRDAGVFLRDLTSLG